MSRKTMSAGHGPHPDSAKEKFWRATLRALRASGQSVRAFCIQRGLSEPSLYAWRRMLAQRDAAVVEHGAAAEAAPAFVAIRLADVAAHAPIEIVLAGGPCIRLRPPVDRAALMEILAAFTSAPVAPQSVEA